MTEINNIQTKPAPPATWTQFLKRLNGPLHEKTILIYAVIVVAHMTEHIFQAYQIYVAGWARPDAKGALGFLMPALVSSEVLHFTYAVFVIGGLILLRPAIRGLARTWWDVAIVFQIWHLFEHSLLQWQAVAHVFFFGASAPTSVLQIWIPRPELHLLYNLAVTIPTLFGLYFHRYPPKRDREMKTGCTCAGD